MSAGRAPRFSIQPFFGLPLADTGVDGLIRWLVQPDPSTVAPRCVGYLNAHTVNLSLRRGSVLGPVFQQFDLLYPDGMSVVRAARRRGFSVSERVSAADFFARFCWASAASNRTLALVGGTDAIVQGCRRYVLESVPGLKIPIAHHGFPSGIQRQRLVADLAAQRPDVVLLGMGSPTQEGFALELRNRGLPTVWCVGALFEYHAPGIRRHAPLWMRENGLEWIFRLAMEPRRLAGRYLLGNLEFLLRTRGIIA